MRLTQASEVHAQQHAAASRDKAALLDKIKVIELRLETSQQTQSQSQSQVQSTEAHALRAKLAKVNLEMEKVRHLAKIVSNENDVFRSGNIRD